MDHQTPERTDQEDQNQLGHQEREEFQNQPIHQAQLKQDQKRNFNYTRSGSMD